MTEIVSDGRRDAASHLLFAHGAGAGMDSAFLVRIAKLLADAGLCVHRFEFAYMAARRDGGSRRPPPRAEKLSGEYEAAVAQVAKSLGKGQRLFIGGKSMGGRVASLVADALWTNRTIAGLVCVGYPFHPIGQPFDPSIHEAVTTVATSEGIADGQIVGVVRPGYLIGEDVLRPALVAVAGR